jgi:hypothetical protein
MRFTCGLSAISKIAVISSQLYIGCEGGGTVRERPYAVAYINRFIEIGMGANISPGKEGNDHYIDKHHFYHVKETDTMRWSVKGAKAIAFKMRTNKPGIFQSKIFFPGDEIEGCADDLIIRVEGYPTTRMNCADSRHAHKSCAVGIEPRIRSVG